MNNSSYGLYTDDYTSITISRVSDGNVFIGITEQESENESNTVSICFPFEELKRVVDLLGIANPE